MKTNGYTEICVTSRKISPRTQWIDCGLRAMKTDGNAESCARRKEDSWYAMGDDVEGCN